jgi:hypothetical protein
MREKEKGGTTLFPTTKSTDPTLVQSGVCLTAPHFTSVEALRHPIYGSHLVGTGVRGHDLPAVIKLLEVHRGVSHHLLVGTREIDGPPSQGECCYRNPTSASVLKVQRWRVSGWRRQGRRWPISRQPHRRRRVIAWQRQPPCAIVRDSNRFRSSKALGSNPMMGGTSPLLGSLLLMTVGLPIDAGQTGLFEALPDAVAIPTDLLARRHCRRFPHGPVSRRLLPRLLLALDGDSVRSRRDEPRLDRRAQRVRAGGENHSQGIFAGKVCWALPGRLGRLDGLFGWSLGLVPLFLLRSRINRATPSG